MNNPDTFTGGTRTGRTFAGMREMIQKMIDASEGEAMGMITKMTNEELDHTIIALWLKAYDDAGA